MFVKLLTEYHLEFLSLKESCTGLSESTLVKMPHCWKSRVMAQNFAFLLSCGCKCSVSLPCGAMGWSVTVAFPVILI